MSIRCALIGHAAGTTHRHNQGLDFATCHQCGCDLIRAGEGEWTPVPRGFRIVWREFGRAGDAAAVAARMARSTTPPRRRAPRNARPLPRRDPRGHPLSGAASVFGALAKLGKLLVAEAEDAQATGPGGHYVICLPGARGS